MRKTTLAAFAALAFTVTGVAAQAAPVAVTFNPGVAVAGTSTFTADKLNLIDYSRVDLTGNNFNESGFLQVNNASLNNNTFDPAGNRSTYSLYIQFTASGTQSLPNFNGSSTGVISNLSYTLFEAAGASSFGITANQPTVINAGATTALATGSLIAGTTSFSANPLGAGANVDATFIQSLAGFIVSPANAFLTLHGAFNNNSQLVTVLNSGTAFTLNGGGGDLTFTAISNVPEPASLSLIGAGLIAIGAIRRRKNAA